MGAFDLFADAETETQCREEIATMIFKGGKLSLSQRVLAYWLITGKDIPLDRPKRKPGRPKGTNLHQDNIALFKAHVLGGAKPRALGIDGYNSALRAGKLAYWEHLEKQKQSLLLRQFEAGTGEEAARQLATTEHIMQMLDELGQVKRGRGWCKKIRKK